ncbi:MAG: hypothetical protein JO273_21480 [Methylobacteriaceae bacterium]|nr:hypothetical protein [Methylobacteriaceae bacterium]
MAKTDPRARPEDLAPRPDPVRDKRLPHESFPPEKRPAGETEDDLDEALMESFPASDPPSISTPKRDK